MKQLTDDPWEEIDRLYRMGDVVTSKVARVVVMVHSLSLSMMLMV